MEESASGTFRQLLPGAPSPQTTGWTGSGQNLLALRIWHPREGSEKNNQQLRPRTSPDLPNPDSRRAWPGRAPRKEAVAPGPGSPRDSPANSPSLAPRAPPPRPRHPAEGSYPLGACPSSPSQRGAEPGWDSHTQRQAWGHSLQPGLWRGAPPHHPSSSPYPGDPLSLLPPALAAARTGQFFPGEKGPRWGLGPGEAVGLSTY